MKKGIIVVGMGQGLSMGIAEKFGQEGYKIGMISRSADKLAAFQSELAKQDIEAVFATADVGDTTALTAALENLKLQMGRVDVLEYNAVDYRMKPIMEETAADLTKGFQISVANALSATQTLLSELKANQGAVLLTGGGSANYPSPAMASISLGKAGIKNLAYQLHEVLKAEGIYVGTVTISGWIQPNSPTHSPQILADLFWQLNMERSQVEIVH